MLRTSALTLWIICEPLIRAKLTVLQCATDIQIHRSDHAPERSRHINRFALSFLLDLDLTITHQPITRISDLASLKIFKFSQVTSQMISFPFYRKVLAKIMNQNHRQPIQGTQKTGAQ